MRILICDDDLELSQQLEKILISFFQKSSLKYPEIVIYNNGFTPRFPKQGYCFSRYRDAGDEWNIYRK